jgi:chromatin remodeling complex protein RSC6
MSTKATSQKNVKATKSKVVKAAEPVPEPVVEPVVEPVIEPTVETQVDSDTMRERFERLIKSKQDLILELKREVQELRKLQRDHEHAVKDALKKSKKKKVPRDDSAPRKPSGFASPVMVSDEMYGFLEKFGVKKGDLVARTDVTRYITAYIKEHDLQNPEFRREILPDAVLTKLFGPALEHRDPNDESTPKVISYLKLQKYLSPHFPKKQ